MSRFSLTMGPVVGAGSVFGILQLRARSKQQIAPAHWLSKIETLGFEEAPLKSFHGLAPSPLRAMYERDEGHLLDIREGGKRLKSIRNGLLTAEDQYGRDICRGRESQPSAFRPYPFRLFKTFYDYCDKQAERKNDADQLLVLYLKFMRTFFSEKDLHKCCGLVSLFYQLAHSPPSRVRHPEFLQHVAAQALKGHKGRTKIPDSMNTPEKYVQLLRLLRLYYADKGDNHTSTPPIDTDKDEQSPQSQSTNTLTTSTKTSTHSLSNARPETSAQMITDEELNQLTNDFIEESAISRSLGPCRTFPVSRGNCRCSDLHHEQGEVLEGDVSDPESILESRTESPPAEEQEVHTPSTEDSSSSQKIKNRKRSSLLQASTRSNSGLSEVHHQWLAEDGDMESIVRVEDKAKY